MGLNPSKEQVVDYTRYVVAKLGLSLVKSHVPNVCMVTLP